MDALVDQSVLRASRRFRLRVAKVCVLLGNRSCLKMRQTAGWRGKHCAGGLTNKSRFCRSRADICACRVVLEEAMFASLRF